MHGDAFAEGEHDHDGTFTREDGYHGHTLFCDFYGAVKGTVIFSIIVFRPEVPDIIGTLEELQDKNR